MYGRGFGRRCQDGLRGGLGLEHLCFGGERFIFRFFVQISKVVGWSPVLPWIWSLTPLIETSTPALILTRFATSAYVKKKK